MPRAAYVNGAYVPHSQAHVHIEDRGYQFADAVYEVVPVMGDKLIDMAPHWDRLERSLSELDMPMPCGRGALTLICRQVLARNKVRQGAIYVQVSRGVAPRDHVYAANMTPSLVITAKAANYAVNTSKGIAVATAKDERWGRVDIKSVGLLPNCMAKTKAVQAGFDDAWLVDGDGMVTEGTSNNAWIVTQDQDGQIRLITRDASTNILNGITRVRILSLAAKRNWLIEERAFGVTEARQAQEAFVTSSTAFVKPVTRIDDSRIGTGSPGEVTKAIGQLYQAFVEH